MNQQLEVEDFLTFFFVFYPHQMSTMDDRKSRSVFYGRATVLQNVVIL